MPKSLCCAINGIACCIFQEMLDKRRPDVISKCVSAIVAHVVHENAEVCTVALQALGSLSHIGAEIRALDAGLLDQMVVQLCQTGQSVLAAGRPGLCTNVLYTLLEIMLAGDAHNPKVAQSVFSLCDAACSFQRSAAGGTFGRASKTLKKAPSTPTPAEPKEEKKGGLGGLLRKKEKPGVAAEPEKEQQEVSSDIKDVQDAGETVAEMLLAHLDNFPPPAGPEICECREYDGKKHQGDDDMNPNTIFWIFGDNSLLSMRQVDPCTAGPIVRVTLRNMTGRFVWDAQLQSEPLREHLSGVPVPEEALVRSDLTFEDMTASKVCILMLLFLLSLNWFQKKKKKAANSVNTSKEPRGPGVLPTPEIEFQHDGLFETLSFLHEEHGVILPSQNVHFTTPYTPTALPEEELSHYETSLELQDEDERNAALDAARSAFRVVPKPIANPGSTFHLARLFFAQMGFTAEGQFFVESFFFLCLNRDLI